MTWRRFGRRGDAASGELSDTDLVGLSATEPQRAWDFFIERYAGLVLATLQGMGFDQDEAMDRFVFVCEKLCEGRFRRLRSVRFAGNRGELVPWIRTVVKNLAVSWAWSISDRDLSVNYVMAGVKPA